MRIYFYDGSSTFCMRIEISMNRENLIIDKYKTVPLDEVIRIVD